MSFQGIKAAIKALKTGSVSQSDVDQAKSTLLVAYLKNIDTSNGRFENLHAQILRGGESGDVIAAINSLTVADVNAVRILFFLNFIIQPKYLIDLIKFFI